MTRIPESKRPAARAMARTGAVVSAVMLVVTAFQAAGAPAASAAATNGGAASVVTPIDGRPNQGTPLASGGSATEFTLLLPTNASCTGDSANDDYRVQSYMVPVSVDPATLTFDANGPISSGVGANFRQPLYDKNTSPYVNAQTADADPVPGPGPIINIPIFEFAVFEPGNISPGVYNVGIACTLGSASATQLDKYFNVQMTFATAAADAPAQVTWTAANSTAPTTTVAGVTITTTGGTSTTIAGGSTTTSVGGSTTTTAGAGSTTTSLGGAPTTSTPIGGAAARLPSTGSSTVALVVWALLFLTFGRIAFLLRRGSGSQLPPIERL